MGSVCHGAVICFIVLLNKRWICRAFAPVVPPDLECLTAARGSIFLAGFFIHTRYSNVREQASIDNDKYFAGRLGEGSVSRRSRAAEGAAPVTSGSARRIGTHPSACQPLSGRERR